MKFHPSQIVLVCAGLLALGILPLPYGYYQFLRWVVFFVAGFATYFEWDRKKEMTGWAYAFACMALLWNPFILVHLTKIAWVMFDLVGAGIMVAYWKQTTNKQQASKD